MVKRTHMSAEQAKAFIGVNNLSWNEWEKKGDQVLRVNGWEFDSDRVMSAGPLLGAGVPQKQLGRVLKLVNSYYRPEGRPDRTAWRQVPHPALAEVPDALRLKFEERGQPLMAGHFPLRVLFYIEYKSGGGVTSKKQNAWIERVNTVPGCFGYVAHPSRFDELVELAGGVYP